jgi:hypothetical protein
MAVSIKIAVFMMITPRSLDIPGLLTLRIQGTAQHAQYICRADQTVGFGGWFIRLNEAELGLEAVRLMPK